jgi:hypothetical protein
MRPGKWRPDVGRLVAQGNEPAQACDGGLARILEIGIQLDGHVAVVAGLGQRPAQGDEVDGALAGREVAVLPTGRDVLELDVPDLTAQLADRLGRVLADAVDVADVEVHRHGG